MMDLRFLWFLFLHASFVLLGNMSEVHAMKMQDDNSSVKCKEREKQSLLALKQAFGAHSDYLSSWGSGESQRECCNWEGVQCSNRTGHVVKLILRGNQNAFQGTISPSLAELHHLHHLDLSYNTFNNLTQFPKFIASLAHLKYLDLSYINVTGKIPYELGDMLRLQYLDLHGNGIYGEIPLQLGNLSQLVHLNLADNKLIGKIPHQLGNLSSLKFLDLTANSFGATDLEWVSHLTSLNSLTLAGVDLSHAKNWIQQVSNLSHLQELDLQSCNLVDSEPWSFESININSCSLVDVDISCNNLTSLLKFPWLLSCSSSLATLNLRNNHLSSPIPEAFGNFSSLLELDLGDNQLEGRIPKSLFDICNLSSLDLSWNNLNGRFDEFVSTYSHCAKKSLQVINLSNNQITGSVPDLSQLSFLEKLGLDHNELNGTLSNGVGQLSNLNVLSIGHNSLYGEVTEAHFLRLGRLKQLDMSYNAFIFNINSDWIPPFQLDSIELASCKMGPNFPIWLQTQDKYFFLDISSAEISTIPDWFWNYYPESLNLSHNQIRGKISSMPLKVYGAFIQMDLSSNLFEGSISSNLTKMARSLDLSSNRFTDANSFLCPNMTTKLAFLDLSNNQLSGELPNCWTDFESLGFLNLENNSLYGRIPTSIGSLKHIQALHLGNNGFMGEIPFSLNKCRELKFFDVSQNYLSGFFPSWIGEGLNKLLVLMLRSNQFSGTLPSNICHLSLLQILDLSSNNISGSIPKCLNNLTALASQTSFDATINYVIPENDFNWSSTSDFYNDSASLVWKGKESKYKSILGLLRSIDLSRNMLIGEIPNEMMDLIELVSLNISRNMLSGKIPPTIGQLKSLDSLDLSRNYLSGRIPSQLSQIDRLSVLNLSYNNFLGEIPHGTQLQSFDASTYTGNAELCGAPLSKCPTKQTEDNQNDANSEEDEQLFSRAFYISMAIGFSTGFWGICSLIFFNKSWRYAYFKFLSDAYDKVNVMISINMAKFWRRMNRAST